MMGPTGPGPWDPAYGYPAGQGTGGPQPPPDPQSAQTAQNVGTGTPPPPSQQQQTPQPPTVDPSQKQTPPGFSLNDVATNLQDKPELDLGQRFNTYYNLIKQTLPDAERPHLDESTKPGLLANILTFGGAGMWDHDYRQAYNAAVDKHNADLHGTAMKNALSMVADDVRQHTGDIGTQIRLLGLYQQMMNSKSLDLHRNVMEQLRNLEVGISKDRLGIAQQELDRKRTIKAPDEKTRAILEDNGFVFVPDPQNPGNGWAVPKDSPNARFATHGPPGAGAGGTSATSPAQSSTSTPTSGGPPPTLPTRHNNPGSIKDGPFARSQPGYAGTGDAMGDGGNMARFDSPESGFNAMTNLLQSRAYRNLTLGDAVIRWTNGGHREDFVRELGLDPSRTVASLNPTEMSTLVHGMARGEGFQPGATQSAAPAANQPAPDTRSGLGTSGTTTNGIQYRVVQPEQSPAANQPPTGARNPADPNAPGISAEERHRRTVNAEKTAAQPIPEGAAKQISNIDESIAGFDHLEKLIQDPEVKRMIGPGMSRLVSEPLYYTGVGAGKKVDDYLQRVAYLRAQAVGPLLHGSRNEKIWAQIQQHLPKESDSPEVALEKIRTAREIYRQNRAKELQAASMTRGEAGATAP